ncbi:MAG: hypothetical protein LLG05_18715 [Porphyromonadaceae bacterium]|nr:hypothetical protein [Porphyromonadaceae bacterium]
MANVEPQTETVIEPVNAGEGTATPETVEKTPQTPEQNAEFARVRREAETKASAKERERADKFAQRYGYSTFDEMESEQARAEAEAEKQQFVEKNGFDPDSVKPLFEQWKESDPDFQELKSVRAERNATKALSDLNRELEDAGVDLKLADLSDAELNKVPNIEKVTEYVTKGHSLADAFFLANKKDIISKQAEKAQQDTIKKINANGESSPGSLSGGGEDVGLSDEAIEKMPDKERMRRWPEIKKFYNMK